jgi:hypothetical protein
MVIASSSTPHAVRSFTLRPRKREVMLRICGVIDLCAGVVVFILGVALMAVGTWQGVVAFVASLVGLWAGTVMTWSRVYATSQRILTMANRPHRAKSSEIAAIDVCPSSFGQIRQVVPIVRRKNGTAFKLTPLCLSSGPTVAPQFREQRRAMLAQQQMFVGELRSLLGVGGSDYIGD